MKDIQNTCNIKTGFVAGTGLICTASGTEYKVPFPPEVFSTRKMNKMVIKNGVYAYKAEGLKVCL